jgi:hypothetical protein
MQPLLYRPDNLRMRAEEVDVRVYANIVEAVLLPTYLHAVGKYTATRLIQSTFATRG